LNNPKLYTTWDLHGVKQCDILFGYMEEINPSGYGLAAEIGYAKAMGKTIILVDERSVVDDAFKYKYAFIHNIADVVFDNLDEGMEYLGTFLCFFNYVNVCSENDDVICTECVRSKV
jgi:nucleoside 2-deoxyribosyltransferase